MGACYLNAILAFLPSILQSNPIFLNKARPKIFKITKFETLSVLTWYFSSLHIKHSNLSKCICLISGQYLMLLSPESSNMHKLKLKQGNKYWNWYFLLMQQAKLLTMRRSPTWSSCPICCWSMLVNPSQLYGALHSNSSKPNQAWPRIRPWFVAWQTQFKSCSVSLSQNNREIHTEDDSNFTNFVAYFEL